MSYNNSEGLVMVIIMEKVCNAHRRRSIVNRMDKQLLKTYIKSIIKESQAEPGDPYGEYLFAPQRKDLKTKKREPNTPEEDALLKALEDHYNNEEYTLGGFAPELLDLIQQGKYSKVLSPPPGPYYRVLSELPAPALASFLGVKPRSLTIGDPTEGGGGTMTPGGRYSGSTGIHSWTTKLDSKWLNADILTRKYMKAGEVLAIIVADESGGDFLINPKGMSAVEGMPSYVATQNEVISFGPVAFDSCVYYVATGAKGEMTSHEALKLLMSLI